VDQAYTGDRVTGKVECLAAYCDMREPTETVNVESGQATEDYQQQEA